jgi:hypothetical protein
VDKLDNSLEQRVQSQFSQIEARIGLVNESLTAVELEFEKQQK